MKRRISFIGAGSNDRKVNLADIRRQLGEAIESVLAANGETSPSILAGVFWKSAWHTYAYRVIAKMMASRTIMEPGYSNVAFRDNPAISQEISKLRRKAIEEMKQLLETCDCIAAIERRVQSNGKDGRGQKAPRVEGAKRATA